MRLARPTALMFFVKKSLVIALASENKKSRSVLHTASEKEKRKKLKHRIPPLFFHNLMYLHNIARFSYAFISQFDKFPLDRKVRLFLNFFNFSYIVERMFFVNLFFLYRSSLLLHYFSFPLNIVFHLISQKKKSESTIFHIRNCFTVHFNGC